MGTTIPTDLKKEKADAKERQRIKVLRHYAILDSEPEQEFDDLAAMAAHICGTPIALISLVDVDRQWFKAKVGLKGNETPRSHSFCTHALDSPHDILMVPDAMLDDRFIENPLVTGDPGIRFYAGAPLLTSDDAVLGTLCVIDRVPRKLSATQLWMLQTLSWRVVRKLEKRLSKLDTKKVSLLPPGIRDMSLAKMQNLICANPSQWGLWLRLLSFLARPILDQRFSFAYISGAFLSGEKINDDVKVVLQPSEPFGPVGFEPLHEYFISRQERIRTMYSIDLRFWIEDLPSDVSNRESCFLPHAPWTDDNGNPSPVARINLRSPTLVHQFNKLMDPFRG